MARSVTEPTSPLQIADFRSFWLARFLAVFSTLTMVVLIAMVLTFSHVWTMRTVEKPA